MENVNLFFINSLKNMAQFLVGVSLYYVVFGNIGSLVIVFTGLLSLLLTYMGVYLYNDLIDYNSDVKDEFKRRFKLLARGEISKKFARKAMYVFFGCGILLSLTLNLTFLLTIFSMIFINYLYSSPQVRLKSSTIGFFVSITFAEFFKFLAGWASLSASFVGLPTFFILAMSLLYVPFVYGYKLKLSTYKELLFVQPVTMVLFAGIILHIISFLSYNFKFQLLVAPLLFLLFLLPETVYRKESKFFEKTVLGILAGIALLLILSTLLFLQNAPTVTALNNYIIAFLKTI